jgi:cyclophilin family peptidyl-prolyl cis-trans isomerase
VGPANPLAATIGERVMMRRCLALSLAFLTFGCGNNNPQVEIVTNKGTIKAELFERQAPITVKNFLDYVDGKHYDGTIFHRVIYSFMIQGGGFKPGMEREEPTREPIKNESSNGLKNQTGTLAMARTGDPHSATAQFFINVVDNPFLDRANAQDGWGYAVFGQVTEGMDIVNKIRRVRTQTVKGHENVPIEDVVIESIRRIEKK